MNQGCVVVGDRSACYAYLHSDGLEKFEAQRVIGNPLEACAQTSEELDAFNVDHPLFGGAPVDVLVSRREFRRQSSLVRCHVCSSCVPGRSFSKLRDGLFIVSPELAFARMANHYSPVRLAELGGNLCARYYLDGGRIRDRRVMATSPEVLRAYLESADGLRGRGKALKALRWVLANSGSPMETKMQLLLCMPMWAGGFALPFDAMNYDVSAERISTLATQGSFCIDLAASKRRVGVEYDGEEFHRDASRDKRRLNALKALHWEVFPIDRAVLFSAENTERVAFQVARCMRVRKQKPGNWESRYASLREELGLSS